MPIKQLLTLSTATLILSVGQATAKAPIVGGDDVEPHRYPFIVSLETSYNLKNDRGFCGGTLIDADTVVTAAHCVDGDEPEDIEIALGKHARLSTDGHEQYRRLKEIRVHKEYNSNTIVNDIAILKLSIPADLNDAVQPLPLPKQGETVNAGDKVTAIGWGYTANGLPDVLQEVDVPVVSQKACRKAYGKSTIKSSMLCAGVEGKDSCQGDSGGPLFKDSKLAGIVSWGYGCAEAGHPGVYTRVSSFADWIESNRT